MFLRFSTAARSWARCLPLCALLAGCSPALNWRSVPLPEAALTFTLPCKPDRATRTVELAGVPVQLSMVGCEADGAMLALSHVVLADPSKAGTALTHWRAAVLAQLGPGAAAAAVDTCRRGLARRCGPSPRHAVVNPGSKVRTCGVDCG